MSNCDDYSGLLVVRLSVVGMIELADDCVSEVISFCTVVGEVDPSNMTVLVTQSVVESVYTRIVCVVTRVVV